MTTITQESVEGSAIEAADLVAKLHRALVVGEWNSFGGKLRLRAEPASERKATLTLLEWKTARTGVGDPHGRRVEKF